MGRSARLKSALKLTAGLLALGCFFIHAQQAHAQATGTLTVEQVKVSCLSGQFLRGGCFTSRNRLRRAKSSPSNIFPSSRRAPTPYRTSILFRASISPMMIPMACRKRRPSEHPVIKGANIAEMVDGVPLNDAGNYAIYAGELVDPEVISNVNVITGSTDVDSPPPRPLAVPSTSTHSPRRTRWAVF